MFGVHQASSQPQRPMSRILSSVFAEVVAWYLSDLERPGMEDLAARAEAARRTRVLCVGKMAHRMALQIALAARTSRLAGMALIPADCVTEANPFYTWVPVDHPHSTTRNRLAASRVCTELKSLAPDDLLIVGLSGGASAYLAMPRPEFTLEALDGLYSFLRRAGASIHELNTIRKHCEVLKGGRAAEMTAAEVVVLVASDVIGDDLDVIGSGPFCADTSTLDDCRTVFAKFGCDAAFPEVVSCFASGTCTIPETPKQGAACFARVQHRVIANNAEAVGRCEGMLIARGIPVLERVDGVTGSARDAAVLLVERMSVFAAQGRKGAVLIGGEPTVDARSAPAESRGGPSQELALAALLECDARGLQNAVIATLSTDGIDGESDSAGAVAELSACLNSEARRADAKRSLERHDSSGFFGRCNATLRWGATGVNLNHVAVGVVC